MLVFPLSVSRSLAHSRASLSHSLTLLLPYTIHSNNFLIDLTIVYLSLISQPFAQIQHIVLFFLVFMITINVVVVIVDDVGNMSVVTAPCWAEPKSQKCQSDSLLLRGYNMTSFSHLQLLVNCTYM